MSTTTTEETIPTLEEKIQDLCQFLLDDPAFVAAQGQIEAFQDDKAAQEVYQAWQAKGAELHQMQHEGRRPSDSDIVEVERLREAALDNSTAADFCEAEDSINEMFGLVMKYVQKTLQNGRMPTEDDINGCCGSGG